MTAEQDPAPTAHLWREIAFNVALVATAVVARADLAGVLVPVVVALLLVAGAYAIASGGDARPRAEPRSPIEADKTWAKEILARPQWLNTMSLAARWGVMGFLVFWMMQWDTPLQPLLRASAVVIPTMLPIVAVAAFALTWWERRDARRALGPVTRAK